MSDDYVNRILASLPLAQEAYVKECELKAQQLYSQQLYEKALVEKITAGTHWQEIYKLALKQAGGIDATQGRVIGNPGLPIGYNNKPVSVGDPDGPLIPLPDTKAINKAPYPAPAHDYIAMLYRPYAAPI